MNQSSDGATKPVNEWASGGALVVAATGGMSVAALLIYTSGVFFEPLQREFGWSRTEIVSGLTINSIVAVVLAPILGRLVDRHGARTLALPGLVLFTCAFAALGLSTGSVWLWWAMWFVLSISASMLSPTVWTSAVAERFDRHRGLALAITLSGTGVTGIVGPLLATMMLSEWGWRGAYMGLAVLWCVVILPLATAFFWSRRELVGRATATAAPPASEMTKLGDLAPILRSGPFICLSLGTFLVVMVTTGALVHFVPFLLDHKVSPSVAATAAGIIGIANILGRIGTGFVLDRLDATKVGAFMFGAPIIVMVGLLGFDGTLASAFALAFILGVCVGAELDIAAYLTSRSFGTKNFGLLFGVVVGLVAFAAGAGPLVAGAVADSTGDYRTALWAAMPLCLCASALVFGVGSKRSQTA
jgi:MFS family permease